MILLTQLYYHKKNQIPIAGHALHERSLKIQIGVVILVSSQE